MMDNNQAKKNPIDMSSVLERIGGDESFLYELLKLYTQDFLERFEELKKAVNDENYDTIQKLGHTLKGSSANLSLTSLQEASYEMEKAGRENNIERAKENLIILEQEFQRLKKFLSQKNESSKE